MKFITGCSVVEQLGNFKSGPRLFAVAHVPGKGYSSEDFGTTKSGRPTFTVVAGSGKNSSEDLGTISPVNGRSRSWRLRKSYSSENLGTISLVNGRSRSW